jgi:hypothetical protein
MVVRHYLVPSLADAPLCSSCQLWLGGWCSLSLLDFLGTWVAGGLGLGGLGLSVGLGGLGLPQAPQSSCEFVSVSHVWTPISSSACSVCSFLFFFTSINIFCFQQVMTPESPSPTYHHPITALYTRAASSLSRFAQTRHAPPYDPKYCVLLTARYISIFMSHNANPNDQTIPPHSGSEAPPRHRVSSEVMTRRGGARDKRKEDRAWLHREWCRRTSDRR